MDGDLDGALTALDRLANSADRLDRARAGARAIEVRLASGKLDAAHAAQALDTLRYAWRGDRRELALRERLADMHQRAGAWREAFSELRGTEADFPQAAGSIHAHLAGMFASLLSGDATTRLTPLDLVAMVDENADLLTNAGDPAALQEQVADRLMTLDLPERAAPILQSLITTSPDPDTKARLGARLAALRLREDDAPGALTALAVTQGPGLDPAQQEQRALLRAAAHGRLHDPGAAIADLAGLTGPAADTTRATILEQAGNWAAAEAALARVVAATIPESGPLSDHHRDTLLRYATAAARAGDTAALTVLQAKEDDRIGSGPAADMLRLLKVAPVPERADMPRLRQEADLMQRIPAGFAAATAH